MPFELDLTDDTPETADLGGFAPPGWYRVKLTDTTVLNDTGANELEFTISDGPCAGLKIKEKLNDPSMQTDEAFAKKAANKLKLWATRLGAVNKDDFGKAGVVPDFLRCLESEYVIQTETRTFPGKDKNGKPTGETKNFTGPTYSGIYPLTHEGIPADVRAALKLPPAVPKNPAAPVTASAKPPHPAVGTNGTLPRPVDVTGL